jgi:hypothetical protein
VYENKYQKNIKKYVRNKFYNKKTLRQGRTSASFVFLQSLGVGDDKGDRWPKLLRK